MFFININMIEYYIKRFKNSSNLDKAYNEFNLEWLNSYDEKTIENIKLDHESIIYEKYFGNGEYNKNIINNFINTLEKMLIF